MLDENVGRREASAFSLLENDLAEGRVRFDPGEDRFLRTSSWYPVSLDAILDGDDVEDPPAYLERSDGAPVIYPDRSHVFYGPSESLKSWAALAVAASVLGSGRSVFYVDFESDRRDFVKRARVVGIPEHHLRNAARPRLVYLSPGEPLGSGTTERDIFGEGDAYDPALVVLDGITDAYGLHGLDPNSAQDVARFHRQLLRRFPCATLGIDHTAKRKGSGALGSQHKRAGVDVVFEFVPKQSQGRGGHSFADLYVRKDRHGFVRELAPDEYVGRFHVDTSGDTVGPFAEQPIRLVARAGVPSGHDQAIEDRRTAIATYVSENPGASTRAIRESDSIRGRSEDISSAIAFLEAEGVIEDRGTAARSAYYAIDNGGKA